MCMEDPFPWDLACDRLVRRCFHVIVYNRRPKQALLRVWVRNTHESRGSPFCYIVTSSIARLSLVHCLVRVPVYLLTSLHVFGQFRQAFRSAEILRAMQSV